MRQTNVRGSLSLRGFRKLRTGAIVATGVILLGLGFLAPTVSASEQDGVWVARTVAEVKADIQKEGDLFKYVIKWGDTLSVISEASNIPVDVLQEMNQASGKNLFLPHNELYFTEAETVSDTVTKHKIVIKESGASGEVRTYEVLLKKDQETKAVTFELTDVTEKVEKMTVNYSPVYQPVSAPVVERAEESVEEPASEAPAETSPEVKEETEAPVAPKAEDAATTPAPKETAPEVVTPAPKEEKPVTPAPKVEAPTESSEPKGTEPEVAKPAEPNAETPTPKVEAPTTPTPKEDATEGKVEAPKVEEPEASAEPKGTASVVEEGTSGEQDQPAEETPAPSKPETPAESTESKATEPEVAKPAESNAEAATESTEASGTSAETTPKENETEGTTPGATAEAGETTGEASETTSDDQGKESKETEDAGEEVKPAPKEDASEGKVSEASGEETGATVETGTTTEEGTSGGTGEASEAPSGDEGKEEKETEEAGTEVKPAPNEAKETEESEANPTPKENVTEAPAEASGETEGASTESPEAEGSVDSTPKESTTEGKESAEGVPGTVDSAPAPKETEEAGATAEETPAPKENKTEGTTTEEGTSETTGETSGTTEGATTAGEVANGTEGTEVSNVESESKEEKPQADEPAVEHKDSEQSLKKETEDSNKTAIDEDRKTKDEEINKSTLSEDKKKEELEKVKQLTEEYHNKLKSEQDTDKQADLVDKYRDKLREIETPGVEHDGPDFKRPIESHAGGTTIDENSTVANSALTSSNPSSQPSSSGESSQTQPAATSDNSTADNSGFRSAGTYQPRVTRRPRSVNEPQNKVSIYYNFDGMKDIPGFFDDLGGKNEVDIPKGVSGEALKSILKARIDKKKAELESKGYKISDEYFVGIDQADATHYDYVVTFTKETTGTTGFRIAPKVQVRAKKVVKRDLSNKTKKINIYYNLTALKDIAGALGEVGENNLLTLPGNATKEDIKKAVVEKTKAQIEKLKKQGFTVKSTTDLDQIVEGGDSYDYVVEFTKESKTQPVGTTGFRMAPAVQPRASRNRRSLEQPAPQKVKVNVFYNFDKMKDIAGFLGDINGTPLEVAEGLSDEQVKAAVKSQVDAKKEELSKRGYTFKEDYVYQANGKDYNYVVTFSKATK